MNTEHKLRYQNTEYKILAVEQEFIVHPVAFGFLPYTIASIQCPFSCDYELEDYKLFLRRLTIGTYDAVNYGGVRLEGYAQKHEFNHLPVTYNGVILIGANPLKEYYTKSETFAYYSYQKVIELVFENGILITTVDQSRAMLRIRKNLELNLRSLTKKRDVRCISRFMNSAFIGDYKPFHFSYNRMNYVKEMKKDYTSLALSKFINSTE